MTEQEINDMIEQKTKEKVAENQVQVKVNNAVQEATDEVTSLIPNYDEKAPKPNDLIEGMFNQAIGHVAQNDKDKQAQILDTAGKVIDNKIDAIKNDAENESKTSFFKNNEDACQCYGFTEKTTPKWAVKVMRIGYNIMLTIYIILASVSVMPVSFLCKKLHVIVKNTWLVVVLAILIWGGVTIAPILITYFNLAVPKIK